MAVQSTAPSLPPPPKNYIQRARTQQRNLTARAAEVGSAVGRSSANLISEVGYAARSVAPESLVRAYKVWPTKNVFCCWGFLMTGPVEDVGPNSCAWTSLLTPMAIFFYTWSDILWDPSHVPPVYSYFCCLAFASAVFWFSVTSFTDPGIIPRGPKPSGPMPPQRTRTDERGATVYETWCSTCNVYRPPRSSHCSDCDNCVRDFDHHCPFTRNCIGARNYGPFVMFLSSTCLSLAVVLISALALPTRVPPHPGALDPHSTGLRGLASTVSVVFCAVMAALLFSFTAYHVSLICAGMTTKASRDGAEICREMGREMGRDGPRVCRVP